MKAIDVSSGEEEGSRSGGGRRRKRGANGNSSGGGSETTAPRRNPKRQVQIEKEYMKLLDEVLCESKREARHGPARRTARRSGGAGKTRRRAAVKRGTCAVGAVYSPPSPLSARHVREWPAHGMHERPEYRADTCQLHPFPPDLALHTGGLAALCHETCHHVLAWGATVASLAPPSQAVATSSPPLVAAPLDLSTHPVLHDTARAQEVLACSLLLYSLTNELNSAHLAAYVDSLCPREIIQWSNKHLQLQD